MRGGFFLPHRTSNSHLERSLSGLHEQDNGRLPMPGLPGREGTTNGCSEKWLSTWDVLGGSEAVCVTPSVHRTLTRG